jgi:hypothetical protein
VESLSPWLESYGPAGYHYWGNLGLERSLSTFYVSQRLVLSYTVDLPVGKGKRDLSNAHGLLQALADGWGLDGILTLQTGFPLAFSTSPNNTHDMGVESRPNSILAACPNGWAASGSRESRLNAWFNVNCFSRPSCLRLATFRERCRTCVPTASTI